MRILIIEDEEDIAQFVADSLKEACFVTDMAYDGEKGSFLARTNEYDVIILDSVLPQKSGKEVCCDIRKQGNTVPILMLSALSEAGTKAELLESGADDYLSKPFAVRELVARVRALLRRPKEITHEVLSIDDLVLDSISQSVKRGDTSVMLTRKEFMLLEYFLRNRGRILSRMALLEHVWDMHADPFSNTIESHIRSLRQKITVSEGKKLIHTLSGRGYVLDIRE